MISNEANDALQAGNYAKAIPLLKTEAQNGNAEAQFRLGDLCMFGTGIKRSEVEAKRWFREAMEQGHAEARFRLAMLLISDERAPAEESEGRRLLRMVAETGHEMAQHNLGVHLVERGDVVEGVSWLKRVAEFGSDEYAAGDAASELGELFREGKLIEKDGAQAVNWLKRALDHGQESASYHIARIYYDGDGMEKDYSKAAKWFRRAAEMGYSDSLYRLGQMYLSGEGVTVDKVEAARLFCRGADRMDPDCMNAFAVLFREGVEIDETECEIIKWYRKAMDEDDRDLQRYLGLRSDTFNRLNIFAAGGLLAVVALVWLDWVLIVEHVISPTGQSGWFQVGLLTLAGAFLSSRLSRSEYRAHNFLRVQGFPFPVTVWEPMSLGTDQWLNFDGIHTIISPVLNAAFAITLLIAVCLLLPPEIRTVFVIIVIAEAGRQARVDQRRKRLIEED